MKFSYVIIYNKKIEVEQIFTEKENEIKFLLNDNIRDYFYYKFNGSLLIDKLIIGTNDKNITLLDCCYSRVITSDGKEHVHLIYKEFTNCMVNSRNFDADKLIMSLSKEKINKSLFDEISFNLGNFKIMYISNKTTIDISISTKVKSKRYDLFNIFAYNYELLNIIIGFFPVITKSIYYDKKKEIVLKQKYVDKYYTNSEYVKDDLCFFDKIDTSLINDCLNEYIDFSNTNRIHVDTYFLSMMKQSSYIDIRIVNILHSLDGIYDKLEIYSNQIEEYPCKMNDDIIERLTGVDISDIQKKYEEELKENLKINFKEKIENLFGRSYLYGYRRKLKNLFSFDDYIVFENEKKRKFPMCINCLVEKCVNTRNKYSHADEHEKLSYLSSTECLAYLLKLTLLYRLHLLNQLGIYEKINKIYLKNHIGNVDRYINRIIKKDIFDTIFKHVGMRKFDLSLVDPIKNNKNQSCQYKPVVGGYWASPEKCKNSWENIQKLDQIEEKHICKFKIKLGARIKYIFENSDLYYCPHINKEDSKILDFEKMCNDYDAIYYCPNEDNLSLLPMWDCVCILILNTDIMDIIENI